MRLHIYKNIANVVSILGILPLFVLFKENGFQYLIPLIIYNNAMDDLDGILAAKLNIKSEFGASLDNVCDAIAHSAIVMAVGVHFGPTCTVVSLVAVTAVVWRLVSRLDPQNISGAGSPTNELIRHIFFVLVFQQSYTFSASPYLIALFLLHSVSMLVPYRMPYLIRGMTKSALAVSLVNMSMVIAWLVPTTTPVIAASFMMSYMCSLIVAFVQRDSELSRADDYALNSPSTKDITPIN